MTNYGTVKSLSRPQEIEFTDTMVFIASDISTCEMEGNNEVQEGYQYTYVGYSKDEYIASLAQELKAAKILLGVD